MPTRPSSAWRPIRSVTRGAHVAALGDVAGVAEALHQLRPGACDAAGLPAELGRLAREAVARQGRQHQVECVLGVAAVRGRVGERADGLEQLDDRAGPAMRHDQRQRVLMPRPDVDEVDLDPVDLGRELRQRVQSRLALAPVVLGRPVAGERLQRRQLHALRSVCDELLGGPARRRDTPAQVIDLLLWNLDLKRRNLGRPGAGGSPVAPPAAETVRDAQPPSNDMPAAAAAPPAKARRRKDRAAESGGLAGAFSDGWPGTRGVHGVVLSTWLSDRWCDRSWSRRPSAGARRKPWFSMRACVTRSDAPGARGPDRDCRCPAGYVPHSTRPCRLRWRR